MQSHGIASPCLVTGTPSSCCLKQEQTFPHLLASGAALMPRLWEKQDSLCTSRSPPPQPSHWLVNTSVQGAHHVLPDNTAEVPPGPEPTLGRPQLHSYRASVGSDRWPGYDTKGQREASRLCHKHRSGGRISSVA